MAPRGAATNKTARAFPLLECINKIKKEFRPPCAPAYPPTPLQLLLCSRVGISSELVQLLRPGRHSADPLHLLGRSASSGGAAESPQLLSPYLCFDCTSAHRVEMGGGSRDRSSRIAGNVILFYGHSAGRNAPPKSVKAPEKDRVSDHASGKRRESAPQSPAKKIEPKKGGLCMAQHNKTDC